MGSARCSAMRGYRVSVLFSEPKIPQWSGLIQACTGAASFSALQRAENSSITELKHNALSANRFQCSSASRKFLNRPATPRPQALDETVSVLFSEPKIPQSVANCTACCTAASGFSALQRAENSSIHYARDRLPELVAVSVLFSEPKIPQSASLGSRALSVTVSVLFSEPKIPQSFRRRSDQLRQMVSVLFSEPKIPQCSRPDR